MGILNSGAVAGTAGKVAIKAGATVSKFATKEMLATAAKIDKAAIAVGENIGSQVAGEIGRQAGRYTVTTVTQYGTEAAKFVGENVGKATTNLASNVTTKANAKIIGSSAGNLSMGASKLKISKETKKAVDDLAKEV